MSVVRVAWCCAALAACAEPDPECAAAPELDAAACELVAAMRMPDALPPARGNAHGDAEDAAELGFQLFFRAEAGHGVACATCHDPTFSFTDRDAVSTGHGVGTRNAPTTLNAAWLRRWFWDGRADSLWSQPLFAFESPAEMATSRLELVHFLATDPQLGALYAQAFGPMPDLADLPAAGMPGEPAWDALAAEPQDRVNRIVANVGKAIEAYERKNSSRDAPLDRYLDGEAPLSDVAQAGLGVFVRAGCASCHAGPLFTDEAFHVGLATGSSDEGAAAGVELLADNPFNLSGPYADPIGLDDGLDDTGAASGAFRTPSLRRVADTAPYGHDGSLPTLGELLAVHAPDVDDADRALVGAFLRTLTADLPSRPWSTWPSPQ